MAYESNLIHSAPVSGSGRIAEVIANIRNRIERRRIYNETLRELNALGARELNDLGLNRSEIRRVAWQAAYGD